MKICSITSCKSKYRCRGYCALHYKRFLRGTNLTKLKIVKELHGKCYTKEYSIWRNMLSRCNYKNSISYKNYGGRGIKVCDRWLKSFQNFFDDMGNRSDGLTLERINNDGNYEPSNCRWATRTEQNFNQRLRRNNKSRFTGVSKDNHNIRVKSWRAVISFKGKQHLIGYFLTKEEAARAYIKAKRIYYAI